MDISHQSIENFLLSSELEYNTRNWDFSGYYLFDALWVKIKGI